MEWARGNGRLEIARRHVCAQIAAAWSAANASARGKACPRRCARDIELRERSQCDCRRGKRREKAALGEKLRRPAGGGEADDERRMKGGCVRLQICDDCLQIKRSRDLRRCTLGLGQKFADFTIVVAGNQVGTAALPCLRVFVMVAARAVSVRVRRVAESHRGMVVVVAVIRREQMQTLAEQRDAGVSGQQRGSQDFAEVMHLVD